MKYIAFVHTSIGECKYFVVDVPQVDRQDDRNFSIQIQENVDKT